MQITHNEVTAGLCVLAAIAGPVGLMIGRWRPSRQRLDEEWQAGRDHTIGEACHRVERRGMVLRLSPEGRAVWCDAGSRWDRDGAFGLMPLDGPESDADGVYDPHATYDELSPLALSDGELPDPPTNIDAWWGRELGAILRDDQSEWFTEMSAA